MRNISLDQAIENMVRRGKIAESRIQREKPELLKLFITYQNEALAAREYLDNSLLEVSEAAEILEVGGGVLALTIQLASEGFNLTTVEPVGEGFTGITYILNIFLEIAIEENSNFKLMQAPIEECEFDSSFDFIFSINVMEHLRDPLSVLLQLAKVLKPGGKYRFFCPNYDFPYEPHFAKWLPFRKNGAFFLSRERAKSRLIEDREVEGLYNSLNFITLTKLIKFCSSKRLPIKPNRDAFFNLLNRVTHDLELSNRHKSMSLIVKVVVFLKIHYISKLIPSRLQPVIDCELTNLTTS